MGGGGYSQDSISRFVNIYMHRSYKVFSSRMLYFCKLKNIHYTYMHIYCLNLYNKHITAFLTFLIGFFTVCVTGRG